MLDFDLEKQCSVTLSNLNIYSCLTCGKYYQGKGKTTQAYIHSLEQQHNVFINLQDSKVWCLPDNYEVDDAALNDIKYNLIPLYNQQLVDKLDSEPMIARALDGTQFYPGSLGLNNLKQTDFVNVIIQSLCRVKPLRDYCLFYNIHSENLSMADQKHLLVVKFAELIKKIWNPKNFKGHVSPHELLQAISLASQKRFKIGEQKDPIQLLSWLLNTFNEDLHSQQKQKKLKGLNMIEKTFQGELEISSLIPKGKQDANFLNKLAVSKTNMDTDVQYEMKNQKTKFFFLALDLPTIPLFKEQNQLAAIPQIALMQLLKKYDGKSFIEEPVTAIKKKFRILSLPKYLIIHVKRFNKNDYFTEKNPTIVNFPIKNLDLSEYLWSPIAQQHQNDGSNTLNDAQPTKETYKYDLIANIIHEGKHDNGQYRVQIHHKPTDEWYDIQDLHVNQIMPQQVVVSECYILVFERQSTKPHEEEEVQNLIKEVVNGLNSNNVQSDTNGKM
eukprot:403343237